MQLKKNGALIHSPRDLVAFLDGAFASWMDRLHLIRDQLPKTYKTPWDGIAIDDLVPDEQTEDMELVAKRGYAHEATHVAGLKQQNDDLVEILRNDNAVERTLAEMKAGRKTIYQGCLTVISMLGYPDFLVRVAGASSFGPWHYEPWDTKLALSAKPGFIIQVCAYCDMLETIQSRRPEYFSFVLGDKREARLVVDEFFFYYRRLKQTYLLFQDGFDPSKPPDPGNDRAHGRWSGIASKILESQDHLCRVAHIMVSQIKKLSASGITTLTALAETKLEAIPRIQPESFQRLKTQARLQLLSMGKDRPVVEIAKPSEDDPRRGLALLPPHSPQDIFFDMEGFPLAEGGLEYLFGAVFLENDKPAFADWWAHDEIQERKAFEGFVDWAYARWEADKTLHIYHYAPYETTAVDRLKKKSASRGKEVDDLLRNHVFVDLYTVVRQGLVIGSSGYSLKDIECLYMPKRKGAVNTASGSIVAYQHWLDSGQPQDWRASVILKEIRDYNEVDCQSLRHLGIWLRAVQQKAGIQYLPPAPANENKKEGEQNAQTHSNSELCRQILDDIASGPIEESERKRVAELLAWLLEFHWREAKPMLWRRYNRQEMTEQELYDDFDCLAGLDRTARRPGRVDRSNLYEYTFDPDQDTKLHKGSKCLFANNIDEKTEIDSIDSDIGRVTIKISAKKVAPPAHLNIIPDESVRFAIVAEAIYRFVDGWRRGEVMSRAVGDLLFRQPPRITGYGGGPIIDPKKELIPQLIDLVERLDQTTLCIQGPPGTGKTYAIGRVIAQLLKRGKRIGITAISHKVILNALKAVYEACSALEVSARLLKVGEDDDPLVNARHISVIQSKEIERELTNNGVVVGGTAWAFSRPELLQKFDYLFIDEAGQFSLANVVGAGLAARNLVLVGDQMQLSQPIQGSHPKESGQSGLEYLLNGRQTIPLDFGVFLNETRRLHPDLCRFISDAVYEGRLTPHPSTSARRIIGPDKPTHITRDTGMLYIPVEHAGNRQDSEEEVEVITKIVGELLSSQLEEGDKRRAMTLGDILLVAPYNMQVRRIEQRIGAGARVGSVDRFQGQEAAVVIVSMCTSSLEDCPRGAEFLLNRNRLNVAISRAQCLAIVIGSPHIMASRCQTIEQMRLVNLYCRIADYSESQADLSAH